MKKFLEIIKKKLAIIYKLIYTILVCLIRIAMIWKVADQFQVISREHATSKNVATRAVRLFFYRELRNARNSLRIESYENRTIGGKKECLRIKKSESD